MADDAYRKSIEERIGRPFDEVQQELEELFGRDWDEVVVVLETAATKRDQSHADVIAGLLEKAEHKPDTQTRIKRSLIRWIGKPWRERENPWDKFRDRVPPLPPKIPPKPSDLDEWTPLRPDED